MIEEASAQGAPQEGEEGQKIDADAAPMSPAAPIDEPLRLITREEIMQRQDIRWAKVAVDEWRPGASLWIRSPTAADRDWMEFVILGGDKTMQKDEVRASIIAMCCVKADGSHERMFEAEDVTWLKHKNAAPVNRIYEAILKSVLVSEADVDELAKNSGRASGVTS